jgi:hypothetical protein
MIRGAGFEVRGSGFGVQGSWFRVYSRVIEFRVYPGVAVQRPL